MLDALLETIGTLAVLASIAAKFVYFRTAPGAGDEAGRDRPADPASELPAMKSERPGVAHAAWRERR
ncbi:hypothetical protein F2P45_27200 [Massilia sp. CCM 8733]|uniref:Uncharacterized protein n=1 Tax=Massilia mucilaginosa TaxID=2609282 RepID=A0ABX0P2E4_9BURK|nr:hypothetical protein [Massilia mucilaginosa]NHZ92667.1 hypothetical protein [Massilia mucilaginosa]